MNILLFIRMILILFLKFVDSYPSILFQIDDDIKVIATKFEISNCKDIDDLIILINNKIMRLEKNIK